MPFTPLNAPAKTSSFTPLGAGTPPAPSLSDSLWTKLAQGVQTNVVQPVKSVVRGGIDQMGQAQYDSTQGKNPLETGLAYGSGLASVITSPFAPIFASVSKGIQKVGEAIGSNPSVQKFAETPAGYATSRVAEGVSKGIQKVGEAIGSNPSVQKFAETPAGYATSRVAEGVSNAANITGTVMPLAGGGGVTANLKNVLSKIDNLPQTAIDTAGAVKQTVKNALTSNLDEAKVTDLYNRAISPTVVGKSNAGQITKANTQAVSGLKSIADNKANLTFTDANGETITGQTPKSVDQLTQSIAQTKKSIFQQYDNLAKQAGEQGVTVDAPTIAKELTPVIESKSLSIANPRAVEHAKTLQERLNQAGGIDAQTAQDVIQHYNESLKAFYRNPSYDTASNASIDAMIANKFREALDNGITSATGEQYQALKNQYGALSSMEKDVAHRNVVWGRQNAVGLAGNLANITSGAELVRGLITMNPADVGASVAIKGIQKYMKYLNNPDVGVSKIFSELEKPSLPSTGNTKLPTQVKQENGSLQSSIPQPKTLSSMLKEPKGGLSMQNIAKDITPASVAKKMDNQDFFNLQAYLKNPHNFTNHMNVQDLIDGAKLGNADPKIVDQFLRDTINEFKGNTSREVLAKPQDPLLSQAQKAVQEGKTMEEFVKAQGTPVYHGSPISGNRGISYAVFDPSQIKTRSQLEALYNQAKKAKK